MCNYFVNKKSYLLYIILLCASYVLIRNIYRGDNYVYHETVQNVGEIPKILHMVWVTPYLKNETKVPLFIEDNMYQFKSLNPDFQVMLWRREKIEKYFPELLLHLEKLWVQAHIADVLRIFVIREFGGVYMDTDFKHIKPIGNLLKFVENNGGAFFVCASHRDKIMNKDLCKGHTTNAVFGAIKQHPIMKNASTIILQNSKNVLKQNKGIHIGLTGPVFLTSMWRKSKMNITVLPSHTFYPCPYPAKPACANKNFTDIPEVYGMHLFEASWMKKPKKIELKL